ncbi:MAG: hypothetical protein IJ366_09770 [Clostridia bacterium]|nr:hypothetical protein [Clostridia bacterium]
MDACKELKTMEAQEYRENNGIVMRIILTCHRRGWFDITELVQTLSAYKLTLDDIMDAVDYFDDSGYIETRDKESKAKVKPCDLDFDEIEIRLCGNGHLVARGIIKDDGISL